MSFSLLLKWRRAVDCGLHRHPLLRCQQHVVHRLETEPLRSLDHAHGTVYFSSSATARYLSPSRNISRLIYLVCLFWSTIIDYAPYDAIISSLHCIALHYITRCLYVKRPWWSEMTVRTPSQCKPAAHRSFFVAASSAELPGQSRKIMPSTTTECRRCSADRLASVNRQTSPIASSQIIIISIRYTTFSHLRRHLDSINIISNYA